MVTIKYAKDKTPLQYLYDSIELQRKISANAMHFILEPGDMTHYEFLWSYTRHGRHTGQVIIVNLEGQRWMAVLPLLISTDRTLLPSALNYCTASLILAVHNLCCEGPCGKALSPNEKLFNFARGHAV